MRIAIIGAGFSGLSVAWNLLQNTSCEVVVFDSKAVGAGASGMAAGLLHPYVGEEGKRSVYATEGMEATKELIAIAEAHLGSKVAAQNGIVRHIIHEKQRSVFLSHVREYQDIRQIAEDTFLIESGITVDCPRYLEGLWQALLAKGAKLVLQEIADVSSLKGFDHIVIAAGAGIASLLKDQLEAQSFKYVLLKGQLLICKASKSLELPEISSIGKGFLAVLPDAKGMCHVGSTYERQEKDVAPNREIAEQILYPKIAQFFPQVNDLEVVECKSAMRVIRRGHYFPIATKIKQGLWILTALGSRGLLYHGHLGKQMARAILDLEKDSS